MFLGLVVGDIELFDPPNASTTTRVRLFREVGRRTVSEEEGGKRLMNKRKELGIQEKGMVHHNV